MCRERTDNEDDSMHADKCLLLMAFQGVWDMKTNNEMSSGFALFCQSNNHKEYI